MKKSKGTPLTASLMVYLYIHKQLCLQHILQVSELCLVQGLQGILLSGMH